MESIKTSTKIDIKINKLPTGRKCCISFCKMGPRTGARLFEITKQRFCFNDWLKACDLTIEDLSTKPKFICEHHFEQKFTVGRKLAVKAIPTLNLYQNLSEIVSNTISPMDIDFEPHCNSLENLSNFNLMSQNTENSSSPIEVESVTQRNVSSSTIVTPLSLNETNQNYTIENYIVQADGNLC